MRSALGLFCCWLGLAAGVAHAEERPAPGAADPRMRTVAYDPDQVYRLDGLFRTATQIVFAPDETVLHVALGDSIAWEVAVEGNVLFVKPREQHQPTNLLVTTARATTTRHYAFELKARTGRTSTSLADAIYQVRFLYPQEEAARQAAALSMATAVVEDELLTLQLQQGAIAGPRNLAYSLQGARSLEPSEVSDNGRFTLLRFPGGQSLPAIFTVTEDGTERLTPFDVRGEFVVVHGTAPALRLRRGAEVLCIYNDAFNPRAGQVPGLTASAEVDRVARGARP